MVMLVIGLASRLAEKQPGGWALVTPKSVCYVSEVSDGAVAWQPLRSSLFSKGRFEVGSFIPGASRALLFPF